MLVSATTEVGRRKSQEDRFVFCPRVLSKDVVFFGVFDGTVGAFAAEYIHANIVGNLVTAPDFAALTTRPSAPEADRCRLAAAALRHAFHRTDEQLLAACAAEGGQDYASSTGVAVLIAHGLLTVAHVGDSRAVLATELSPDEPLEATALTVDHKPDQEEELRRIEEAGGSLTYLHGGKPFIRGGDFAERQAMGDRPMQLNYSRAFGGKDLKPFGLSVDPDVSHLVMKRKHRMLVIASDGVWDVLSSEEAIDTAVTAVAEGKNPSRAVVDFAAETHIARRSADNITAIVVFFSPGISETREDGAKGAPAKTAASKAGDA